MAKKRVFPTFRLEYLKILTWYDNLAVGFGFSAKKYIKRDYCIPKKVNWPLGCRPVQACAIHDTCCAVQYK